MGLVVSAYGPLLEHLTRRFGVSLPVAGGTISVHFGGGLLGVLIAMRSMERLPARVTVMVACGIGALGCAAVAVAFIWPFFLAAIFVVGLGFGALVLGLNQLVATSAGRRRAALLSGLNSASSAGAVAGPVLVAAFARDHFSILFLAAAAVALALIPGAAGIVGRLPIASGSSGRPGALVLVFIVAFTLYVAVETGTGGWMPSHLESTGVRSQDAAAATSGFFLAIVTGRLLMTLMPARVPEAGIVIAGAVLDGRAAGCFDRPTGAMGLHRGRAGARSDLSDRDRVAGEAEARRLTRNFVAVPGCVSRRYHRTGGDRAGDRRLRSGLDPGGPRPCRRRHVGRVLARDP